MSFPVRKAAADVTGDAEHEYGSQDLRSGNFSNRRFARDGSKEGILSAVQMKCLIEMKQTLLRLLLI